MLRVSYFSMKLVLTIVPYLFAVAAWAHSTGSPHVHPRGLLIVAIFAIVVVGLAIGLAIALILRKIKR